MLVLLVAVWRSEVTGWRCSCHCDWGRSRITARFGMRRSPHGHQRRATMMGTPGMFRFARARNAGRDRHLRGSITLLPLLLARSCGVSLSGTRWRTPRASALLCCRCGTWVRCGAHSCSQGAKRSLRRPTPRNGPRRTVAVHVDPTAWCATNLAPRLGEHSVHTLARTPTGVNARTPSTEPRNSRLGERHGDASCTPVTNEGDQLQSCTNELVRTRVCGCLSVSVCTSVQTQQARRIKEVHTSPLLPAFGTRGLTASPRVQVSKCGRNGPPSCCYCSCSVWRNCPGKRLATQQTA